MEQLVALGDSGIRPLGRRHAPLPETKLVDEVPEHGKTPGRESACVAVAGTRAWLRSWRHGLRTTVRSRRLFGKCGPILVPIPRKIAPLQPLSPALQGGREMRDCLDERCPPACASGNEGAREKPSAPFASCGSTTVWITANERIILRSAPSRCQKGNYSAQSLHQRRKKRRSMSANQDTKQPLQTHSKTRSRQTSACLGSRRRHPLPGPGCRTPSAAAAKRASTHLLPLSERPPRYVLERAVTTRGCFLTIA